MTIQIIQNVYESNIHQYGTLTCYLCEKPIQFGNDHLEHIVPIKRGGTNERGNLAVACAECNTRKGTRLLSELNIKDFKKEKVS